MINKFVNIPYTQKRPAFFIFFNYRDLSFYNENLYICRL